MGNIEFTVDSQIAETRAMHWLRSWILADAGPQTNIPLEGQSQIAQFLALHPNASREDLWDFLAQMQLETAQAVNRVISEKFTEFEQTCDVEKIESWLQDISIIPDREARQDAIAEGLQTVWEQGFNQFYQFLHALKDANIPVNPEAPESALELENEIYVIAIRRIAQQNDEQHSQWIEFLKEKVNGTPTPPKMMQWGAGLPSMRDKAARYQHFVEQAGLGRDYDALLSGFKNLVERTWGGNYEGFRTKGTCDGYQKWISKFFGDPQYKRSRLITLDHDYMELYQNQDLTSRHSCVSLEDPSTITEEEVAEKYSQRIQELRFSDTECGPFVCGFSSELRNGMRRFDVPKLVSLLRKVGEDLGVEVHVWVDAAQDSRLFVYEDEPTDALNPEANRVKDRDIGDLVFWSKRIGGTEGGLALVNTDLYPTKVEESFQRTLPYKAFSAGGGVDEERLIRLIADLTIERGQIAHSIEHLLQVPALWYYRGGGTFLQNELQKAQEAYDASSQVKEHFEFCAENETEPRGEWRSQRMLHLRLKESSPLVLAKIRTSLERIYGKKNIPDVFAISDENPRIIQELWNAIDKIQQPIPDYSELQRLQGYYSVHLVNLLVPPGRLENITFEEILDRLQANCFIRVYFHVETPTDALPGLIKALDSCITEQVRFNS